VRREVTPCALSLDIRQVQVEADAGPIHTTLERRGREYVDIRRESP
jgi:hypothetical protein